MLCSCESSVCVRRQSDFGLFGAWVHSSCDSRTVEPRPFSRQPAPWNFRPFDRFRNQLLEPFSQPVPFGMVGSNGLGPSTSRLSGVCSNQLSYEPMCGGGNRIRTDDPLLAGQVLYQLSYTPVSQALSLSSRLAFFLAFSKNNALLTFFRLRKALAY